MLSIRCTKRRFDFERLSSLLCFFEKVIDSPWLKNEINIKSCFLVSVASQYPIETFLLDCMSSENMFIRVCVSICTNTYVDCYPFFLPKIYCAHCSYLVFSLDLFSLSFHLGIAKFHIYSSITLLYLI